MTPPSSSVEEGAAWTGRDLRAQAAERHLEVAPFPIAGDLLAAVQLEWDALDTLGGAPVLDLPRPWEPATCTAAGLRDELESWLHDVVDWVNTQHTWNPDTAVPVCWPRHPHLVHEIAVLADQRRRAGDTNGSTSLEQWQRVVLPAFLDRMRATIGQRCAAEHRAF